MKKCLLIILDGFGHSTKTEHNAIYKANTPYIDELFKKYPHSLLQTSGEAVGLPEGVMGNSEVGHITIGSGRISYQDLTKINKFIKEKGFKTLLPLHQITGDHRIHIMGLLSDGGVHSHIDHLLSLIDFYGSEYPKQKVSLHLITDGRDTPPTSGETYLKKVEEKISKYENINISTLMGRFYAMDRDKRWERVKLAYDSMVTTDKIYSSASEAIHDAYSNKETDEFLKPRCIGEDRVKAQDAMVFFNFRADRAREITTAFTKEEFDEFPTKVKIENNHWLCFTSYSEDLDLPVLFPKDSLRHILGEVIAENGLKQLRIAETEKYAHVTYFFSGGREELFEGEDRVLIPSPKDIETYDQKPEMSAYELTDQLVEKIHEKSYDLIVCNYANGDMVGHTGVESAAIQAVEALDQCLSKVVEAAKEKDYRIFITADHGNCEEMVDEHTGKEFTQHSVNPVPLIYISEETSVKLLDGGLQDIAPSVLDSMSIEKPDEMTGKSLLN